MLTGKQLIDFIFSAEGQRTFKAINPGTCEAMEPSFYEAASTEVDRAFCSARSAFPSYRAKSPQQRAAFLEKIADQIMALGDPLIQRCMQETALPEARLKGERGRTVNQLKLFAQVVREGSWVDARIDTAIPDRQPVPKPDLRRMLIPIGPVGVFGASNFPLAFSVAGGDTASALAAGCPVVVKAHPAHPGTSEMIGSAIIKAAKETDMPVGVFSLLQGPSIDVGQAMVNHPAAKAIGFTGSFAGGKALYDAAVRREEPIPVYAEMGSSNPVFILPGALEERGETIAQGLVASVTLGVGQFCTNPGLVFLVSEDGNRKPAEFVQKTAEIMAATPAGTMLTDRIKESYETGIRHLLEVDGVTPASVGKPGNGCCQGMPHLLQTTAEEFIANPQLAEEVFGPSTITVAADGREQLYTAVSGLKGHLTATIHCTAGDLEEYGELISMLESRVGRIVINGFPTGVEVCPSMHHGGPFPATTDSRTTSVGTAAIQRFARPVCYQDFPMEMLPVQLQDNNPANILRMLNGKLTPANEPD